MITEQDIINAAGSQQLLLEILGLPDTTDPSTDSEYQSKAAFTIDEAHAVLTEYLGITFSDGSIAALPREEKLPLVLLASRYAVLAAKLRGRGRLDEDAEADEYRRIPERLQAIASGASWPGRTRPAAQANRKPRFVPRSSKAPKGFCC